MMRFQRRRHPSWDGENAVSGPLIGGEFQIPLAGCGDLSKLKDSYGKYWNRKLEVGHEGPFQREAHLRKLQADSPAREGARYLL